jgi:polyferredoxin
MSGLLFIAGLAMLAVGGGLMYFAWPRNGQIRPFLTVGLVEQIYAFAIILSFVAGVMLLLNAVLN